MTDRANRPLRLGWLDGLRGVAAAQVVLFHYVQAFLPGIGLLDQRLIHYGWERIFINTALFLPFDGFTAVCLFFVLSGAALTYSFNVRPFAILTNVTRRIIRLGLPMIGAMLCGAALFTLAPDAHSAAAHLSGSESWLGQMSPNPLSLTSLVHQIGLEGMLAGYETFSVLPPSVRASLGLAENMRSFDGPLWTLHIEFVGSLLTLALVALRRAVGDRIHIAVCVLLAGGLSAGFFVLFVAGHLAAQWLTRPASRRSRPLAGIALVGLGIISCTTYMPLIFAPFFQVLPAPLFGLRLDPWMQQKMLGAVAIFFGIALLPSVQRYFEKPPLQWLGNISFSLYLTHFPLLFTLVSASFILIVTATSYGSGVIVVTAGGIACSLAAAVVFERCVDRPAIALSRRVQSLRE